MRALVLLFALAPSAVAGAAEAPFAFAEATAVGLREGKPKLTIDVVLPDGRHLNPDAPNAWTGRGRDGVAVRAEGSQRFERLPVTIPLEVVTDGQVEVELTVHHCGAGTCEVATRTVLVDVAAGSDGPRSAGLSVSL